MWITASDPSRCVQAMYCTHMSLLLIVLRTSWCAGSVPYIAMPWLATFILVALYYNRSTCCIHTCSSSERSMFCCVCHVPGRILLHLSQPRARVGHCVFGCALSLFFSDETGLRECLSQDRRGRARTLPTYLRGPEDAPSSHLRSIPHGG